MTSTGTAIAAPAPGTAPAPASSSPSVPGFLLLTLPRSASNLLVKSLMSGQDPARYSTVEYNFGIEIIGKGRKLAEEGLDNDAYTAEERDEVWQLYSEAAAKTLSHFATAQALNKVTVDKEHSVFTLRPSLRHLSNPYWLSDPINPILPPLKLDYESVISASKPLVNTDQLPNPTTQQQQTAAAIAAGTAHLQLAKSSAATIPKSWTSSPSTNVSVLPDAFLTSVTPVFLIRHPSLVLPSFFRVLGSHTAAGLATPSLYWSRCLYEWYLARDPRFVVADAGGDAAHKPGKKPVVIDAADYIRSAPLRNKVAAELGLDAARVLSAWRPATDEEKASWHPVAVKMTESLAASSGLDETKAQPEDLDAARGKWEAEFGEDGARELRRRIEEEMVHWEFFMGCKLAV